MSICKASDALTQITADVEAMVSDTGEWSNLTGLDEKIVAKSRDEMKHELLDFSLTGKMVSELCVDSTSPLARPIAGKPTPAMISEYSELLTIEHLKSEKNNLIARRLYATGWPRRSEPQKAISMMAAERIRLFYQLLVFIKQVRHLDEIAKDCSITAREYLELFGDTESTRLVLLSIDMTVDDNDPVQFNAAGEPAYTIRDILKQHFVDQGSLERDMFMREVLKLNIGQVIADMKNADVIDSIWDETRRIRSAIKTSQPCLPDPADQFRPS
jgi:hypothetical protein